MKKLIGAAVGPLLSLFVLAAGPGTASAHTTAELSDFRKTEGKFALEESKKCADPKSVKSDTFKAGGVTVNYVYETADKNKAKLVTAIKEAIAAIEKAGFKLPAKIDFVLSTKDGVRNVAFMGDEAGNRKATVFLGPQALTVTPPHVGPKGVADQIPNAKKGFAVTLHELGHVAHELLDEQGFWTLKDPKVQNVPPGAAADVSAYAAQNKLEFVAETFTAVLVSPKKYPQEVFDAYDTLHGPSTVAFKKLEAAKVAKPKAPVKAPVKKK